MIRNPIFIGATVAPEAWDEINLDITRLKREMAMMPWFPGPHPHSIEFAGGPNQKYFQHRWMQPHIVSGHMLWDDCPDPDDWHPAADWSFYAWSARVDPQWGNPFEKEVMLRKYYNAVEREDWDEADRLDDTLRGW